MSLQSKYNLKSPGVKRIMREACELSEPTDEYHAYPLEDNIFEWHFTVRGPKNSEFEGGYYHGRILLPSQYPMEPPNIILLTPNGRFDINKKICLSISGHHPESWQPSWSIRTALLALIAFMPTHGAGTIGSLDYPKEERKLLAKKSYNWECSVCGRVSDKLSTESSSCKAITQEESSFIKQITLKAEENKKEPVSTENCLENSQSTSSSRQRLDDTLTDPRNINILVSNESIREKFWTILTWILVVAIIFLVLKRLCPLVYL